MDELARFPPIEVTLRNSRRVRLREIRPDDRDEVQQAFGRLSSESRYMRFMSFLKELSPRMLEGAVNPPREREFVIVAEIDAPDGIDIVGGARYIQGEGQACEFAITVADDWQRVGLASRLMRELITAAAARGLQRMEGFVLASNGPMLGLAHRLGFSLHADPHDSTVVVVSLDLAAAPPPS